MLCAFSDSKFPRKQTIHTTAPLGYCSQTNILSVEELTDKIKERVELLDATKLSLGVPVDVLELLRSLLDYDNGRPKI